MPVNLEEKYGKLLDKFIKEEREKMQAGSGDDLYYEMQVENYINKQRNFWLTFIEFVEEHWLAESLQIFEKRLISEYNKTGINIADTLNILTKMKNEIELIRKI
jgi:hypothetical protein